MSLADLILAKVQVKFCGVGLVSIVEYIWGEIKVVVLRKPIKLVSNLSCSMRAFSIDFWLHLLKPFRYSFNFSYNYYCILLFSNPYSFYNFMFSVQFCNHSLFITSILIRFCSSKTGSWLSKLAEAPTSALSAGIMFSSFHFLIIQWRLFKNGVSMQFICS